MGYYLVRQQNQTIKGPMSLRKLSKLVASLDVTMGDEITGNLGPWVFLDSKLLDDFYPEVASEISMNKGWSHEPATLLSEKYELGPIKKNDSSFWKYFPYMLGFSLVLLGSLLFFDVSSLTPNDISVRLKSIASAEKSDESLLKEIVEAYEDADLSKVRGVLSQIDIRQEYLQKSYFYYEILPYIRYVAFNDMENSKFGRGYYRGIALADLKGNSEQSTPNDCRVEAWRRSFSKLKGKEFSNQLFEKTARSSPEIKALLWHPKWIASRMTKGWSYPYNYHHGCLLTAKAAIFSLKKDQVTNVLRQRIEFQLDLIEGRTPALFTGAFNVLSNVSCIEVEKNSSCVESRQSTKTIGDTFTRHLALSVIYRAINKERLVPQEMSIPLRDPYTKLDYEPESKFLEIIRRTSDPQGAKEFVEKQYPDLKF